MSSHKSSGYPSAFTENANQLEQVRGLIATELNGQWGQIGELASPFCTLGGKMIRAGLVLLSYGAAGGNLKEYPYDLIRIAAVVEMIHCATLLHDDVLDEGQVRRGQPTINNLFGNEAAVLVGDFVLAQSMRLSLDINRDYSKQLARAARDVCRGEFEQTMRRGDMDISEGEYLDIAGLKTASLFQCCSKLGSLVAGAREDVADALDNYGYNLGIAFQLSDDLLDFAEEVSDHKTHGRDFEKNIMTLPIIHYLRTLPASETEKFKKIIRGQETRDIALEFMKNSKSIDYVYEKAREFSSAAKCSLQGLMKSTSKNSLAMLADEVVI